jgi:hypothetical protein
MLRHLWIAGSKRPAKTLHHHLSVGRTIVVTERIGLHLLWLNDGRIFIKPLPRFLLNPEFWTTYLTCRPHCDCTVKDGANFQANQPHDNSPISSGEDIVPLSECQQKKLWKIANGFLYSYACLISYESDFAIAKDNNLLPGVPDDTMPRWVTWKKLAREILAHVDKDMIHPRFHRGELRLSRINTIHRFTQFPLFVPYFRSWRHYGDLVQDNLTWLASGTVFIALVLTAMQVGLATDQLKSNSSFMVASYGFTVFAILGPIFFFSLAILATLYNLLRDLRKRLGWKSKRPKADNPVSIPPQEQNA